jgi:hypothetical protein
MPSDTPLTISDAARRCGVARRTLQRAIQAGRLQLNPDHRVTLAALQQAGYVTATGSQADVAAPPQELPQGRAPHVSQEMTQGMAQALAPLLARLVQKQ